MGKEISFRITSWWIEEVHEEETIVHLNGLTKDNKQVYCKFIGFRPHCYLELPRSTIWNKQNSQILFEHIQGKLKECPPQYFKLETRKTTLFSLKRQFLKIYFQTRSSYQH